MSTINSNYTIITVQKGDTLSAICNKYGQYINGSTLSAKYAEIQRMNPSIKNINLIYVGQQIKTSRSSTPSPAPAKNVSSKANVTTFGLLASGDRTLFALWTWDRANTLNYKVLWKYYMSGHWFYGQEKDVEHQEDTYNAPAGAQMVRFYVKPVSKTYKVKSGNTEVEKSYFTADWSTYKEHNFANDPQPAPSAPTVELVDGKLNCSLTNLQSYNVNSVFTFQVVQDNKLNYVSGDAKIVMSDARYSVAVDPGHTYKVKCRVTYNKATSEWSPYSSEVETVPVAPSEITNVYAKTKTSILVEWTKVNGISDYIIEYTDDKSHFDTTSDTKTVTASSNKWEITGLETGKVYYFRVKSTNNAGDSKWTDVKSCILGTDPSAPTTWSSTTTAIIGEQLNFYWVHNSKDGSKQKVGQIEFVCGDSMWTDEVVISEDNEETSTIYSMDTSTLSDGQKLLWRVRTSGVTSNFGDWSIQRTVDIYTRPTLGITLYSDSEQRTEIEDVVNSFPIYVFMLAGPSTQTGIGYHLSVVANEAYDTVDNLGNAVHISDGEEIFSKYWDLMTSNFTTTLSANNINLDNNIEYTVTATVSMNSGLTATASKVFTVAWDDVEYSPNAEIGIDETTKVAYIKPFCINNDEELVDNISLAVYRRDFDGKFTEIGSGLDNTLGVHLTDPHPALDFARYRIVATDNLTGAVSYYDMPGYYVGCSSIIIQWDEDWSEFETIDDSIPEDADWSGSFLELKYNIDVSDDNSSDVSFASYVGREHPVSYYGTQLGEKSTWSTEIPYDDKNTIYALRRLARWMGDVYVREPSGQGYWANIVVSFKQTHNNLTIPVTLNITRVEGGK